VRKYALILFLLLIVSVAFGQKKSKQATSGQKKSRVELVNSENATGVSKTLLKVLKGTFKQDFSTLTSDSANFYMVDNKVDALGHVIINQGDTLHIYADKLNYDGNTKIAILTDNVKLVDKDAVLTTNHLTYNTATKIATYTEGGKLVNKDNTLLSKVGYYFSSSRDAYFRYDVSLKTPDALVITDTMRYNTGSRISYFYGPTHIYSIKKEKDKDTLYTENGDYNTITEQAAFGKHNLYTTGTKSLKGDSLFYDKLKGYGRAVKHVTFIDKEQKVIIKGGLGTFFKADDNALVTDDPIVTIITETKDTAKTDSVKVMPPAQKKNAITMDELIKKTIPGKIDSLTAKQNTASAKADSVVKKLPALIKAVKTPAATKKPVAAAKPKAIGKAEEKPKYKPIVKDAPHVKRDSVYISGDTLETRILTYKDYKIYQEKQRLARIIDTTIKVKKPKVIEKPSKLLIAMQAGVTIFDTTYHHRDLLGKPHPVTKKPVKPLSKRQLQLDSLAKKHRDDSLVMAKKLEPNDTARIRILIVHHHAKLFKSDLQAKADSMFYSTSDSTIRCYVHPMIWTEGSQLSGDTIHLQMKNKKMDNMSMFPSAFIANIEPKDSLHFNQVAGKRMRGYFKDDKLHQMIITGNAESIYFSRDSGKTTISGMQRSLSNRIKVDFKDSKVTNLAFYSKPDNKYGPLDKTKEEDRILKSFIWKPKDRPISKESILPSYGRKKSNTSKASPDKTKTAKQPVKKATGGKGKGTKVIPTTKPETTLDLKVIKDSTLKIDTIKTLQIIKTEKDSIAAKPITTKSTGGKENN
jgi:lipopolysaccharide export system protein LptA